MRHLIAAAASAALLAGAGAALAQNYPSGTVTIVVPYSPSGSTDPFARFVAGELQQLWGTSVVVENRPGAGSTIGTAYVAGMPADGSTILLTTSAYTTAPSVYKDLPYDPHAMETVAIPALSPFVLTAGANVKANNVAELIEESKGRLLFLATAGLGSSTHFAGELFTSAAGLEVEPVHYKGGSEAMVDLMGGRADLYAGSMTAVIGNVKAGQIKALAVLGDNRSAGLPDVPSTKELGIEGANSGFWLGVFAPAGTSDEIVAKLNTDIIAVLKTDRGTAFLETIDSTLNPLSPEQSQALVDAEIDQWKVLAEERGIKAE